MATIKISCMGAERNRESHDVDLTQEQVKLMVNLGSAGSAGYAFSCPNCGDSVIKNTDHQIAELLIASGVAVIALSKELRSEVMRPSFPGDTELDAIIEIQRNGLEVPDYVPPQWIMNVGEVS